MTHFLTSLTFYEDINFQGKRSEVPPWVFENCAQGKKVLSVKIPNGVYLTFFKGGTPDNLVTNETITYTSDISDTSSFSPTITGYIIQTNTIKSTFPSTLTSNKSYNATLYANFLDYKSALYTFNSGKTDLLNITGAIGLNTGTNIVTLTDQFNQDFSFYGNVIYLPAYLKNITKATVVPLPLLPEPSEPSLTPSATIPAALPPNFVISNMSDNKEIHKSNETLYYIGIGVGIFFIVTAVVLIVMKTRKNTIALNKK